jgi:hypothetical protein
MIFHGPRYDTKFTDLKGEAGVSEPPNRNESAWASDFKGYVQAVQVASFKVKR